MNNYEDDFVLNGCVLKNDSPNDYIIIDEKGTFQGVTERIY